MVLNVDSFRVKLDSLLVIALRIFLISKILSVSYNHQSYLKCVGVIGFDGFISLFFVFTHIKINDQNLN